MVSCVLFPFQGTAVFIVLANRAEFVLNLLWEGGYFFLGGVCGVLRGFLRKMGVLIVVFWWCRRGGWVVKRGVFAVSFLASKNAPWFLSLFLGPPRFGN
jgi:hypothetical protein